MRPRDIASAQLNPTEEAESERYRVPGEEETSGPLVAGNPSEADTK